MNKAISLTLASLTAVATLLPVSSGAIVRNEGEMRKIARENIGLVTTADPSGMKKLLDRRMLSVYGTEKGGYVVVSRSSSRGIIGYSDHHFDAAKMPDGLRWWLDQSDRTLSKSENAVCRADAAETVVEPIVKAHWAQEGPFNQLCPKSGGVWGGNSMTGCVATAMAQAMYAFKYPEQSVGTGYYSTDNGNSFQEAKMNTRFRWDLMRDRYHLSYSDEEANAVAELMRECGYASRMIYSAQGSGANIYDAAHGMALNLQYDSLAMRVNTRAYFRDAEWLDMIRKDITAGRPIVYMAVDPEKLGHAFVLDGLDARGFVHVNWGWKGDADGYFDFSGIGGLNPSYPNPYTGGEIKYNFYDQQAMITGLKPQAKPDDYERYESRFVTNDRIDIAFEGDELMIQSQPVFNFSHLAFSGMLALVVEGEDGHAVVLPFFYTPWQEGQTIPVISGVMLTEQYYASGTLNDTDGKTPRPDGKYRLYFVSWAQQEMEQKSNPQYLRFPASLAAEGADNYDVWEAEISNGHWVASSLKRVDAESSSVKDIPTLSGDDLGQTMIYDLDGRLVHSGTEPFVPAYGERRPVIVKRGSSATKVIF